MFRKIYFLFPLLFCAYALIAQEQSETTSTNTLEEQFKKVIDKSNSYQDYKVIQKSKINRLRSNILDSINELEMTINQAYSESLKQKNTIDSLNVDLKSTKSDLANSKKLEDGITVFGISTTKSTYNTFMGFVVGILFIMLVLFIYKFRRSNMVTKASRLRLEEIQTELENHRLKNLEEQQVLRRKLQDEINKNRNV